MLQIGSTIVSLEVLEKHFMCRLQSCKGICCVCGQSGAPLEEDEIIILQNIIEKLKPYMTTAGIEVVEKKGVFDIDFDNDKVTPLVGNSEECAFCFYDEDIAFCAIEKAFLSGETDFRKPVSCHLYPIRITKYKDFDAVNFHSWNICNNALLFGKQKKMPVYIFLKEPLIRKYGAEWYEQLNYAASELINI